MVFGWTIAVAGAADLHVGLGREFAEPRDAIAVAASGDRILLDAGTYRPVTIGVDVELVGLGAAVIAATEGQAVDVTANVLLRGLVLDGSGTARTLRVGAGATVVVEDAVLRNGHSADWGGCVRIDGATATLRRTTVSGCTAESGGGIYAQFADLTLEAVTVSAATATSGLGGGLALEDSTLAARGSRFEGNLADDLVGEQHVHGLGGGIFSGSSTIELLGCTFVGNQARSFEPVSGRGGALRLWLTNAVVDRCTFETNTADEYGSAIAAASSTLVLSGSDLRGNVVDEHDPDPPHGGAVFCDEYSGCTVTRSWFEGNTAGDGGAICALGDLTVTTSMFCANTATSDGGAIDLGNVVDDGSATVAGNILALNTAGSAGGALVVSDGPHTVSNNHLVGNAAAIGGALGSTSSEDQLGLVVMGNLVAANTTGDGPVFDLAQLSSVEDYDWLWDNDPSSQGFEWGPSTAVGDPRLVGSIASCDPADLLLGVESPLRDAGPEDDGLHDLDGSRNDIGGFGGPSGDPSAFADADGDGAVAMVDCADDVPTVHPAAPELCNGVDDDCDGLVDAEGLAIDAGWLFLDVDGDGVGGDGDARYDCPGPGWAAAGSDCDDADPDIAGAVTWYTDADGDGFGDPASAEAGCTVPPDRILAGGDCNDADPQLAASCEPVVGDDVPPGDEVAPPPEPDFGFGCATGPGPTGFVASSLVALTTLRPSRRTPRPGRPPPHRRRDRGAA